MHMKKLSFRNKLAYGFGSVSFGTVANGFDYFFLIFYSQILGVDAHLVGLALLIALIVDSLSDPIIGYLSDNTHSRWGRRHPFMYAAAIPVSLIPSAIQLLAIYRITLIAAGVAATPLCMQRLSRYQ